MNPGIIALIVGGSIASVLLIGGINKLLTPETPSSGAKYMYSETYNPRLSEILGGKSKKKTKRKNKL
jgi:hypothetical protein